MPRFNSLDSRHVHGKERDILDAPAMFSHTTSLGSKIEHRHPIAVMEMKDAQQPFWHVLQETEENFARFWAMEGATPVFPQHYQTSALIGCVDIVDCLKVRGLLGQRDATHSHLARTLPCPLMLKLYMQSAICSSFLASERRGLSGPQAFPLFDIGGGCSGDWRCVRHS